MNTPIALRTFTFILAGGKGERLYPLTRDRAKPAVPIGAAYRLIDFTLSNCVNSGLERVHVLTQHRRESLHACLQGFPRRGLESTKRDEFISVLAPAHGHVYRGTADAVFQNLGPLEKSGADLVLILSGDHLYKMDYRRLLEFHVNRGSELTIAATECPADAASQFGVLETDRESRLMGFEEKPAVAKRIPHRPSRALVNMGVYVFNRSLLIDLLRREAPAGAAHDFGRDILPRLAGRRKSLVYNFAENGKQLGTYWRDVGTVDGYYHSNIELLDCPFERSKDSWPLYERTGFRPNVEGCQRESLAAEGALVESSAEVIRSILSPGVHIHHLAYVENSILLPGVRVGAGARIVRAVIDENVHVPDAMEIGGDPQRDCEYGQVTESGIVTVPANTRLIRAPRLPKSPVRIERNVVASGLPLEHTQNAELKRRKVGI